MTADTPTFAMVGAVNHGKSSVVSTLAEDDQVRVSSMPGETVTAQRFWLRDLFVFYDTPGFQNALEALPELMPAATAAEPLAVFRDFLARHRGDAAFEAECLLLEPLVNGAGVIYVVDGSEPLRPIHVAEMDILRLTGQPRLAIVNRTRETDHTPEWRRRLAQHFNAVREFDAHRATFADRLELLETLAGIEQAWKPKLARAVAVLREDRQRRLDDVAEIITDLLFDALRHEETMPAPELRAERDTRSAALRERFVAALRRREATAHREIIRTFAHRHVTAAADLEVTADLFADETWRAFGLTERQLVAASTVAGGTAGAGSVALFELGTGGALLGLPTALGTGVGAAAGAAGAFLFGKQRPEIKVAVPGLGGRLHLGGRTLRVGPYAAVNFPWILLDRALGVFAVVRDRAHGRRDETRLDAGAIGRALAESGIATAAWSDADRRAAERVFATVRRGKAGLEDRRQLRAVVRARLG